LTKILLFEIVTVLLPRSYVFFKKDALMNKEAIIAEILTKVKSDLQNYVGDFSHPLSPANAEIMTKNLVATAQIF
jgi:hypothetical protein